MRIRTRGQLQPTCGKAPHLFGTHCSSVRNIIMERRAARVGVDVLRAPHRRAGAVHDRVRSRRHGAHGHRVWQAFTKLPAPSLLASRRVMRRGSCIVAYSLFRDDVKPEWEDPRNSVGGEWCFRDDVHDIDADWRDLCLGAIGETLPCNGVRVIHKNNARVVRKLKYGFQKTHPPAHSEELVAAALTPKQGNDTARTWAWFPHVVVVSCISTSCGPTR